MRLGFLLLVVAAVAGALGRPATAEMRLAMVERPGCVWCAAWDREIAPANPNAPEGEAAPLMRLRLGEPLPPGVTFDAPVRFTPTFVLLVDGAEVGRIEGYPGDEFFWATIARLIEEAPPSQSEADGLCD